MPRNPSPTPTTSSRSGKLNVVIAGGGVAALETALALADLAPDRTDVTVIAPNSEFLYRPMIIPEPFAYSAAHGTPKVASADARETPRHASCPTRSDSYDEDWRRIHCAARRLRRPVGGGLVRGVVSGICGYPQG
jgi:2-polyprenyl-6-methoxyphenol hydroxylase-like FAD-dependent oxidoreductase